MLAGMRLLATDLDGTLIFHHAVGQADAEALVRWRKAGNLLVLATGRSVRLVQHAVEVARASTGIGLDYDYAVCATGTTVIDAAGQVRRTRMLSADQVHCVTRTVNVIIDAPVSVFASTLEHDYVLDDPIGLSTDQRMPAGRFTAAPLSEIAGLGVTSMPLHVPDSRAAEALARSLEEAVDGVSCTRSATFVDVTAAGESKGSGLALLAEHLAEQGQVVSEVAAVGDSWNDISMLKRADVPCAIAGAPADVVAAADGRTTPSVAAFIDALMA